MPVPSSWPDYTQRAHRIWDQLVGFAPGKIEAAANHLMRSACHDYGMDHACWVGFARMQEIPENDPLRGWRPGAMLQPVDRRPVVLTYKDELKRLERGEPGPTTIRHAQMAGEFRANRLCDLVPPSWFESDEYRELRERDIADVLCVIAPVTDSHESYFLFSRHPGQPPFSADERDDIAYVLRGIPWFHRHLLLYYGLLVARWPLTVTERRVLQSLLAGGANKDLAAQLNLGLHTIREHVASIFRKFGVSSRTELMALWLGNAYENAL